MGHRSCDQPQLQAIQERDHFRHWVQVRPRRKVLNQSKGQQLLSDRTGLPTKAQRRCYPHPVLIDRRKELQPGWTQTGSCARTRGLISATSAVILIRKLQKAVKKIITYYHSQRRTQKGNFKGTPISEKCL